MTFANYAQSPRVTNIFGNVLLQASCMRLACVLHITLTLAKFEGAKPKVVSFSSDISLMIFWLIMIRTGSSCSSCDRVCLMWEPCESQCEPCESCEYYCPNCSDYRPNNSTNIQRYCAVIWKVETLFAVQVGVRTHRCHTLPLSLINLFKSLTRCLVYFSINMIRVSSYM